MCFKTLENIYHTLLIFTIVPDAFLLYLLVMTVIKKNVKNYLCISFYTYIFNNAKFYISVWFFSIE